MTDIPVADLETEIEAGGAAIQSLSSETRGPIRTAVQETLSLLDSGKARVAEKVDGEWIVHQWLKKAALLSFRLTENGLMGGAGGFAPPVRSVERCSGCRSLSMGSRSAACTRWGRWDSR